MSGKIDNDAVVAAVMRDDGTTGFCRACGEEQEGAEPDARNYTCVFCGEAEVFGCEELLFMGYGE
jgi:hypothetical protein